VRTRLSLLLASLALVTLPACTPKAPAATGSAADEQAIRDLASQYAAAYAKRDTAAMGKLVTDDYEEVDPTGKHNQGRAGFEAGVAQEFAMMPAGMSMSMTATTTFVRWVNADNAVAAGTWETSPAMPGAPSKGSWMAVVAKHGGTWQMQSALGAADVAAMMPQDTTKKKKP